MKDLLIRHMQVVRSITCSMLHKTTEEMADFIPAGFNNSIRWNLGHIAVVQERLVIGVTGGEMGLPSSYDQFFGAGTKPADWTETPPSLTELHDVLQAQQERIQQYITGRLEEKLPSSFTSQSKLPFQTLGEAFLFTLYHEGMHMETMKQIHKALQ